MKKHLLRSLASINGFYSYLFVFLLKNILIFISPEVNGENGLSESNVKAILQDSYGFMWFGTKMAQLRDGTSILQLIAMIWRRVQVIIILVLF